MGGALDSHALRVANALVGNDDNAAGIEATLGTLRLQFDDERAVAWCGGAFAVRINDEDLPPGHAGLVAKDEELTMVAPNDGGRAWLAISGGIDVPLVLAAAPPICARKLSAVTKDAPSRWRCTGLFRGTAISKSPT